MEETYTLTLFIKGVHFENIYKGVKLIEYRKKIQHYINRIEGKTITHVEFINGYWTDAPRMVVEVREIKTILRKWENQHTPISTYAINLGKILKVKNYPPK